MYGFNIAGPLFENETFSIWEGEKKNKTKNETMTRLLTLQSNSRNLAAI